MSEMESSTSIRALCVAVDVEAYSGRNARSQDLLQTGLVSMLETAAAAAGLDRVRWNRQPQGDGELALVPRDQDERLVVDEFVRRLHEQLFAYNEERNAGSRIRLRVAMHFGIAIDSASGYSGPAPVDVSRIVNSDELRQVLVAEPESDLVVALSEGLYQDLIVGCHTSLRAEAFRTLDIKGAKFEGRAWVRVLRPERAISASAPVPEPEPGSPAEGPLVAPNAGAVVHRSEVVNHFHGTMSGGVAGIQNNFGRASR